MRTTTFHRLGLGLAFAATMAAGTVLAPVQQEPSFTVHEVAGPVAYLEGAGGNIGLLDTEDGFFLIDTQLGNAEEGVVGAVAEHLGVEPDQARAAPLYLLNTHWHGDHVGNNAAFGGSGVAIVAHGNVRRRMTGAGDVEGRTQEYPREALPTLTYEDELALHLGGEEITVRHYPGGHTDGDSVVYFDTSKAVHCGDLFFNGLFPFIDAGSGGSPEGYLAAVGAILEATDDSWKYIPGHGPLATRADLEASHAMIADCVGRVREALEAGRTVQEMQEAGLLDDYAEDWSWGFIDEDRFVADLVAGLSD